jgi:hypothetical protein
LFGNFCANAAGDNEPANTATAATADRYLIDFVNEYPIVVLPSMFWAGKILEVSPGYCLKHFFDFRISSELLSGIDLP